jgi:hypothetical protein
MPEHMCQHPHQPPIVPKQLTGFTNQALRCVMVGYTFFFTP